jgi:hypothetical protein
MNMTIHGRKTRLRLLAFLSALLVIPTAANAQFLGFNLRGDAGIKSGSQPPPGIFLISPLYFRSDYTGLRDRNGDKVLSGVDVDVNVLAVPGIAVTTKAKIAGGTYGFQIIPLWMDQRLTVAAPGFSADRGWGFSDMLFQPLGLGWRTQKTDFLAGYGFLAPTGKDNLSLNMWGHELSAGTTVYLDGDKKWHVAATGFYDFHHKKQDQDLRVGQYLTVEGGVGRSFIKGAAHAGLAYVAQWKVTDDSGSDFPPNLQKSKNRAYGLGPEVALPVLAKGSVVGLVNMRYIWEFGAETNFVRIPTMLATHSGDVVHPPERSDAGCSYTQLGGQDRSRKRTRLADNNIISFHSSPRNLDKVRLSSVENVLSCLVPIIPNGRTMLSCDLGSPVILGVATEEWPSRKPQDRRSRGGP